MSENVNVSSDPITANIASGFAALDEPVETQQAEDTAEAEPTETPAAPETEVPETTTETTETAEATETIEDEGSEAEIEYPESEEALKARLNNKAIPLKVISEMYRYAEQASTGQATIEKLGGEPFIEPLTKIATALQNADGSPQSYQPFFEGVLEAAGETALQRVCGQSVYMAFAQAENWKNNPETAEFGEALSLIAEAAVNERFGTDTATVRSALELNTLGWSDKIASWSELYAKDPVDAEGVIYDQVMEMLETQHDPKLKAAQERAIAAERALQERQEKKSAVTADPQQDDTTAYSDYAAQAVKATLDKVILKNSPLRDMDTDNPEMKAYKNSLRKNLETQVLNTLQADKKLAKGFAQGQHHTSVYKQSFVTALDKALADSKSDRITAEKMLATLYGKSHNGQLASKAKTAAASPSASPTVPTNFADKRTPKTQGDILKDLEQGFTQFAS